jgi:sulfide dehydrogenase cytochrome subunit
MRTYHGTVTVFGLDRRRKWAAIFAALLLSACGGGGGGGSESVAPDQETEQETGPETDNSNTIPGAPITLTQPADTTGRLLASNCFQCHGTGGVGGFESIRGNEASEVLEYLTQPASSEIMAAHAQGYTRAQLDAIIAYLQR